MFSISKDLGLCSHGLVLILQLSWLHLIHIQFLCLSLRAQLQCTPLCNHIHFLGIIIQVLLPIPVQPSCHIQPPPQGRMPSSQHASSSHTSSKKETRSKSMDDQRGSNGDRCDGSNDVATELELKMPGSSSNWDLSAGE